MRKILSILAILIISGSLFAQQKPINGWMSDVKLIFDQDIVLPSGETKSALTTTTDSVAGTVQAFWTQEFSTDCDSMAFIAEVTDHRTISGTSSTWTRNTSGEGDSTSILAYFTPVSPGGYMDSLAVTSKTKVILRTMAAGSQAALADGQVTFGPTLAPGTKSSQRQYGKLYFKTQDGYTGQTKYHLKIYLTRLWLRKFY